VHIPSAFGKGRLYIVPEALGYLHTGVGVMVWSSRINICGNICGRAMCRGLWLSFYSGRRNMKVAVASVPLLRAAVPLLKPSVPLLRAAE